MSHVDNRSNQTLVLVPLDVARSINSRTPSICAVVSTNNVRAYDIHVPDDYGASTEVIEVLGSLFYFGCGSIVVFAACFGYQDQLIEVSSMPVPFEPCRNIVCEAKRFGRMIGVESAL
jgi:hypothetical protein